MATTPNPFSPLNDLIRKITLKQIDPATGNELDVTAGTPYGLVCVATDEDGTADATEFDAQWKVNLTYIGGGANPAALWLFALDAAKITIAKWDAAKATGLTPFLVIQMDSNVRLEEKLKFKRGKAALLT